MCCGRCGGNLYIDTDHYGTFQSCFQCGASRMLEMALSPDLWSKARASDAPGGPRGVVLNRPFGRVLPR